MPKYLFKALDAASSPMTGPALVFPSPRSFDNIAVQSTVDGGDPSGGALYTVALEITIDGVNYRNAPGSFGNPTPGVFGNLGNGGYQYLGPISLVMGLRLKLLTLSGDDSPHLSLMLSLDEKE